jgi:hypothetical protein
MSENITYSTEKMVVNFEVSPHELTVLKQYLQILHRQEIQDQQIKQNRHPIRKS